MAARIFDSPTTYYSQSIVTYPAGQPLIFSIDDDGGSPPDRFVVIVQGSNDVSSSTYVQEAKLYLTPNGNGVAFFDLSKIAEGVLEPPLTQRGIAPSIPLAGLPIHGVYSVDAANEQTCRKYRIQVASYNNGAESSVQDSKIVFVINGTEQLTSGLTPNFSEHVIGFTPGWMTEQKSTPSDLPAFTGARNVIRRRLAIDEEQVIGTMLAGDMGYPSQGSGGSQYVAFPQTSGGNTGAVYFTMPGTNTTSSRCLFFGLGYRTLRAMLAIECGPGGSGTTLPDPDDIDKVMLGHWDGAQVTGDPILVTWDREINCKNGFTQLAYMNTRGSWDYLLFNNRTPKRFSAEGKQFRKSVYGYGGSTFSIAPNDPQYETYAKTGRRSYTLSDLYFDAEQREQLEIAMRSKHVQIRRIDPNGIILSGVTGWEPVTILTNSVVIEPAGSRFYNVSLDVEVAQDIRC